MPDPRAALPHHAQPRRLLLLIVSLALLTPAVAISSTDARAGDGSREAQLRFMWAMAGQESGRDYFARNRGSGAFGKYQIMPFNWSPWAARYLGDPQADQTPWNQETVAYGKIRDLYRWLGSWKRVAYWWLTGRTDRNEKRWSTYARRYVDAIMRMRKRAPAGGSPMPAKTSSRSKRGDWRRSAASQKLRLAPGAAVWPRRGALRDGQILRVRSATASGSGVRWLRVLTADGRLGWLKQLRTVPTRKPAAAARFTDVRDRGDAPSRRDRRMVRPRPR